MKDHSTENRLGGTRVCPSTCVLSYTIQMMFVVVRSAAWLEHHSHVRIPDRRAPPHRWQMAICFSQLSLTAILVHDHLHGFLAELVEKRWYIRLTITGALCISRLYHQRRGRCDQHAFIAVNVIHITTTSALASYSKSLFLYPDSRLQLMWFSNPVFIGRYI